MSRADVYVDGSWQEGRVGYGAVIMHQGQVLAELYGPVPDDATEGTRQVAGELVAVGKALQWCEANGITEVNLHYDYLGIECWATGTWKAKLSLTQRYRDYVRRQPVRIFWHKVKSHTGNPGNERADTLAKLGTRGERSGGAPV